MRLICWNAREQLATNLSVTDLHESSSQVVANLILRSLDR